MAKVSTDQIDESATYTLCAHGWNLGWIFKCSGENLPNIKRLRLNLFEAIRGRAMLESP